MYILHTDPKKYWYSYTCLLVPNERAERALNWKLMEWPRSVSIGLFIRPPVTEERLAKFNRYIELLKTVWDITDISDDPDFVSRVSPYKGVPRAFRLDNITCYRELCVVFNLIKIWERGDMLKSLKNKDEDVLQSTQTIFDHFKDIGKRAMDGWMSLQDLLERKDMPMFSSSEFSVHTLEAKSFEQMREAYLDGWDKKTNTQVWGWSAA